MPWIFRTRPRCAHSASPPLQLLAHPSPGDVSAMPVSTRWRRPPQLHKWPARSRRAGPASGLLQCPYPPAGRDARHLPLTSSPLPASAREPRDRPPGHAHALQHPQRAQDPLALCLLQYHSHLTVLQAGPLSRVQIGVRWLSPLWNRVTGSQLGKGGLKPAIPVFMLGCGLGLSRCALLTASANPSSMRPRSRRDITRPRITPPHLDVLPNSETGSPPAYQVGQFPASMCQ